MELLPKNWLDVVMAVLGVLVAVRTVLRLLAEAASAVDVAIDGHKDWEWPAKLERACVWLDGWLARFPVKAPFLLERPEHAAPEKR